MSKQPSVEDYKQIVTFQSLQKALLDGQQGDHLDQPLAYWAVPSDRRLPLALMGHSVRGLLNTPFEEIRATPGIGRKKIGSLLQLLARISTAAPKTASLEVVGASRAAGDRTNRSNRFPEEFDPNTVSELLWDQWRETARRYAMGDERLGRLAPTLQALPSGIWHQPLSTYFDYTVAQMRRLKTHGEKRVGAVLEVFHAVHQVMGAANLKSHLSVRLMPKFVPRIEQWIADGLNLSTAPSEDSVRMCLAIPLVEQVQVDCGNDIARLAEERLGLHGARQSVKSQAKRLGVTRARIYQLLEACEKMVYVRWPEGKSLLRDLGRRFEAAPASAAKEPLFPIVGDLFFPEEAELSRRQKEKAIGLRTD